MIFVKRNKWGVLLAGLAIIVAQQLQSMDIAARGIRATQPSLGRRRSTGMLARDLEMQAEKKKEIEEKIKKIESSLLPGQWFIYQTGTDQGIIVSEQALRVSGIMNRLLNDMGNPGKGAVPIGVFMQNIPYIFDVLANYENSKNDRFGFLGHLKNEIKPMPLDRLIDIVNKCNHLEVPEDIIFILVSQIDALIQKMKIEDLLASGLLDRLNIDMRKKIVRSKIKFIIKSLRNKMITKTISGDVPAQVLSSNLNGFSSDLTKMILKTTNGVLIWDIQKKVIVQKIIEQGFFIGSLCVSSDGTKVAINRRKNDPNPWASDDYSFVLRSMKDGKKIHNFSGHTEMIEDVAFNLDCTKMVTIGKENLTLWDVATGMRIRVFSDYVEKYDEEYADRVFLAVALSPDGKMIVTAGSAYYSNKPSRVILWNAVTGLARDIFEVELNLIQKVKFSPDGKKILVVGAGKTPLILIDVETGERLYYSRDQLNDVYDASFSPDNKKIVLADSLVGLVLFDVKSGTFRKLNDFPGILKVAFSSDGTKVIGGDQYKDVIMQVLVSDEEEKSLYDCDLATALFLYKLCLAPKDKITILSDSERDIFNSLPKFVQDLLAGSIK